MSSNMQPEPSTSSTSAIQPITDALVEYANITGIDLSKNPFATAIERAKSSGDILELLQEREKAFKDYRDQNRRLINCLAPAVNVIQAFSGILGEAASLVPFPPTKALFVGIDVLLGAASGVTSSYDALLKLFECLANFLMRLEVYTTIPPTPMMMSLVIKIIVELLLVLALTTKQIKQGRFKKFLKTLRGKDKIQDALERLDRLTKDEGLSAVAQTLGIVHGIADGMKVVIGDGKTPAGDMGENSASKEVNKMKRDQLQKDVQHWLSPPDPSTNHNFVSDARHRGTAAWFFESSVLTEWKAKGSFLWIHGKPGAGKSTLLSAIIQDIEGMHSAGLARMAYYYFDFRDVKKQDCYGLLSSLISQLPVESDSCYDVLSKLYSDNSQAMRKPDLGALKRCMVDMLSLPGQGTAYIIIDALDECPNFPGKPSARDKVLELIEELVDMKLPNLHLCVASRPEVDIRTALEPLTTLKISLHDEIGQKEDIIKYIESIVRSDRSMRRWKEEDRQLVIDILSAKAEGMFRWVVCQLDRLCRTLPVSIRKILNDLPKTLDETYGRTLLGIDEEKREFAQRLFQCLTVSIRPLRVEELAEILAVRFDDEDLPTFNADWRPTYVEDAILSVCSSLIAIVDRGGRQVVQFSHFSVKEYLTSERLAEAEERLSYYHILPEPAHTILTHASLSVLLHLDAIIDKDTIDHFPLASYAARHWTNHAQFRGVSQHIIEAMKRLFDPAKSHFAAWVWLYDIDHPWVPPMSTIRPTQPEATILYYVSLCGFGALVEHLIAAHSPDVNGRGGFHTTALHAASIKGHLEVASVLLRNGANPGSCDNLGRVPLHRVSQGGQLVMAKSPLEIAQLLVDSGADVNVTDDFGYSPLHAAAESGYCEIAGLLLRSNANLDARTDEQQTPLFLSCRNGRLDMARFLIDRGSDINSRNKNGFIPLHAASRWGHVDVARLLLDCGSDVNARKKGRWTALHQASRYGYLDLAQLLIDRDADVNAQEENHWTPLHFASRYGYLDLAQLLIDCGADVNAQEEDHWTALHFASRHGYLDLAQLLIDCGADVNAQEEDRWTPLHFASRYGYLDLAQFLIDRGADVNEQKEDRWTALHFASRYGYLDLTQLLIDRGADVNAQEEDRWTALHLASHKGHLDIAKLLIDHGADLDSRNDKEATPLAMASYFGYLEVTRFLIKKGAVMSTPDEDGDTPFHRASFGGHLQVTKFLLECGIDVDIRNRSGQTPLYLASEYGKLDVVRFLIEQGANIDIRDDDNSNPLHIASLNGHLDVVRLMVDTGTPVDVRDKTQQTPLALASSKDKVEVGRFLIQRGANINVWDNHSQAPLHLASQDGHLDMARLLLDHGVDSNIKRDDLSTPLHLASSNGHLEVAELLVQRGASVDTCNNKQETPLYLAITNGNAAIARLLIDHGANVQTADSDGWTVLHVASGRGDLGVVKLLLWQGADVDVLNKAGRSAAELASENGQAEVSKFICKYRTDANTRNELRSTTLDTVDYGVDDDEDEAEVLLHSAVEERNIDTVMSLLKRGVNVNTRNADHETPLLRAAAMGHVGVVRLLIEYGAEVDSRNMWGWTPLHESSREGHLEASRILLDHGADMNARKRNYSTPLHLSTTNGHLEIVKLLLECGADIHAMNDESQTPYQLSLLLGDREIRDLLRKHSTSLGESEF